MKKHLALALLGSTLLLPSLQSWAEDEPKENPKEEKVESVQEKQHEEKEAMERYEKAAAKHGQESAQAKRAWKHVLAEYKEHGDTPPAPPTPGDKK